MNTAVPPVWIAPSLLSADFARLGQEVRAVEAAGADLITFHPEASRHVDRTLGTIREHGCKAGLAFNPATPLALLDHVMDKLDLVLMMSVNPGFGGQAFIEGTLAKLRQARSRIDAHVAAGGQPIRLQVDGGVSTHNIRAIRAAGADTFVAGSAVFGAPDEDLGYRGILQRLRAAATPM